MSIERPTTAVILAGGRGIRLRDITKDAYPKPLVEVQGKPVLHHVLDTLHSEGITHCVVTLNHQAEKIISFLRSATIPSNLHIDFLIEEYPLGTAGAVRNARDKLKINVPFLLVNGDTLVNFQLEKLIASSGFPNNTVMGLCRRNDPHRNRTVELGCDGQVISSTLYPTPNFSEQPINSYSLVNTGVYIFHPYCLDFVPSDTQFPIDDLLKRLTVAGRLYATTAAQSYFNVGTPIDLEEADRLWTGPAEMSSKIKLEAKSWGDKKTLSVTEKYSVVRLQFNAGESTSLHMHRTTEKSHYILSGEFIITVADSSMHLGPGSEVTIKPGVLHIIFAIKRGAILEVTTERPDEDDIVRFQGKA